MFFDFERLCICVGLGTKLYYQIILLGMMCMAIHLILEWACLCETLYENTVRLEVIIHAPCDWTCMRAGDSIFGFSKAEFPRALLEIRKYTHRTIFANREGGFWVDTDTVCLSTEVPQDDIWFACETSTTVSANALKFPIRHPVSGELARLAADPAQYMPWDTEAEKRAKDALRARFLSAEERHRHVPWCYCGPSGVTRALLHFGLFEHAAPSSRTHPVPWTQWRRLYDGTLHLNSPEFSNAWSIHLWGELVRREPDAWDNMHRHSVVSELLDRHFPEQSNAIIPCEARRKVRVLVGICSCLTAKERRLACRETWLSRPVDGIECVFYLGRRTPIAEEPDVVNVWEADDYPHLPAKGLAFYRYALQHYDFDWLFKCDDDTYVCLERLETLCDRRYELIGDTSLAARGTPSGGAGYLMSRSLVERIVAHGKDVPATGAEDVIFGHLASELGVSVCSTNRLCLSTERVPHISNKQVTCHWCSPKVMHDIFDNFNESPVAIMHGEHIHWQDNLVFFRNGRFVREEGGCAGEYYLGGDRCIILRWDQYAVLRIISWNDKAKHS